MLREYRKKCVKRAAHIAFSVAGHITYQTKLDYTLTYNYCYGEMRVTVVTRFGETFCDPELSWKALFSNYMIFTSTMIINGSK